MSKIKVALVGIGNCASSLVQGVEYYKNVDETSGFVPGLMHNVLGGYKISDIEFVAAYDVNREKVGKDLSKAVFANPNCTLKFCDVPKWGVEVKRGPLLDGVGENLRKLISIDSHQKEVNVAGILRDTKAEILINYLPVGSKEATSFYAQQALEAGCAFINAIPEFVVSDPKWARRFKDAGLPAAGDDIKSQVGATIVHRSLIELFNKRGVMIDKTYQLNLGGNADFCNIAEELRSANKKVSKTEALTSLIPYETSLRVITNNYVDFQDDRKLCYIYLKGKYFGGVPVTIDLKLNVEDSPNSGGVMVDVIRLMKVALDRGMSGPIPDICGYYFKRPPEPCSESKAYDKLQRFMA